MAKLSNKEITDDNISSEAIRTVLSELLLRDYTNEAKIFVHGATGASGLRRPNFVLRYTGKLI
jgi:hypothetical protein